MSANPSRRLKREALRAYGWRTSKPRSGRRRGLNRHTAEVYVSKAKQVLNRER